MLATLKSFFFYYYKIYEGVYNKVYTINNLYVYDYWDL